VLLDIPKEAATIPIIVGELKGTTVLWHDLFTNDVLYAEVAFNLRTVKAELLPLIPLFWYFSSLHGYLLSVYVLMFF
jgi:Zn-dependent M16 (insulinase) family peptidase